MIFLAYYTKERKIKMSKQIKRFITLFMAVALIATIVPISFVQAAEVGNGNIFDRSNIL